MPFFLNKEHEEAVKIIPQNSQNLVRRACSFKHAKPRNMVFITSNRPPSEIDFNKDAHMYAYINYIQIKSPSARAELESFILILIYHDFVSLGGETNQLL